ncbi:hypothetical protein ILYODFUR_032124 [Ilyodon furcidens]|uniref:Uncharacterized protein n=1 Tax=Ilyodon furcidens TaxID=33524 RepID=A0ABV0T246_9TELE
MQYIFYSFQESGQNLLSLRDPILVMERKPDDKGTGRAENPDGGDEVEEGRSSADSWEIHGWGTLNAEP